MADETAPGSLRDDRLTPDHGRGGALPARSLHEVGARRNGAQVGGRAAPERGPALPRGGEAIARLDDDGDAGGAMAPERRGRLFAGTSPSPQGRLRIAVPSKGRLREPTIELLHDAGLGPETPGDRALAFPCRNAPVEALLVRADDIPEYVQDGVVDCGITGLDIVRERGANVTELVRLGFGACSLEAAVPAESSARAVDDLAGGSRGASLPLPRSRAFPGPLPFCRHGPAGT